MVRVGDRVVVTDGVFIAAEGTVISQWRGRCLARLRLCGDQELLVELPAAWLEQVGEAASAGGS